VCLKKGYFSATCRKNVKWTSITLKRLFRKHRFEQLANIKDPIEMQNVVQNKSQVHETKDVLIESNEFNALNIID